MAIQKKIKQLINFISYILERRPAEFGLVPDENGFVKIKELLKAVCEEESFKYVRRQHIDEILFTKSGPPFEVKDNLIRSKYRDNLPQQTLAQNLPKLLYTCVRIKAYPFVLEKGIFPAGQKYVILSSDIDLAERIGKRSGQKPVLLIVNVQKTIAERILFYQAGDSIYLTEFIPPVCFSGPPLPKNKPEPVKKNSVKERESRTLAGSFLLQPNLRQEKNKQSSYKKKKKDIERSKEIKRGRRKKEKMWPT